MKDMINLDRWSRSRIVIWKSWRPQSSHGWTESSGQIVVSRDLALMGALTGRVSLLIKKVLRGVGRFDPPLVSWVACRVCCCVANRPWMCWSGYIIFCRDFRRLSCSRSWKFVEVWHTPEYPCGSGSSMWRTWSWSNHVVCEPAHLFRRSIFLLALTSSHAVGAQALSYVPATQWSCYKCMLQGLY